MAFGKHGRNLWLTKPSPFSALNRFTHTLPGIYLFVFAPGLAFTNTVEVKYLLALLQIPYQQSHTKSRFVGAFNQLA